MIINFVQSRFSKPERHRTFLRPILFVLFCLIGLSAFAQSARQQQLPIAVPDQDWRPLVRSTDQSLQRCLKACLQQNRAWASLIRSERMSVGLVDLTEPERPRFASVNGNVMMYAASLPKIAILLAAFQAFEDGSLAETPEIMDELNAMIRTSSNEAASDMINRIGLEQIDTVLQDSQYQLFDPKKGGGLWVGKLYGRSAKRYPDPLKGLSHAATVNQVCRFYYLLATGRLINYTRSQQMLAILADPGLHHKFVNILDRRAPKARLFRKSGTWRTWHADSVLVWGSEWRRYILVALVEDPNGEQILRDLVPIVEEILHP